MSLNAKLVVVGGDVKTTEISLKLPSTIGRGRGTAIVLPHPLVSRQHCELFEVDGQLMVRDLGSLNGTFVNNERITESPLAPDELLTVGTVTFRAVYEADESSPSSLGPKTKTAKGDKTLPTPKVTKVAASPKAAPPAQADSDSGPLEFDFGQPLLPADEVASAKGANAVTERLEATVVQDKKQKAAPPPKAPGNPASSSKKNADDEEEPASSSSDDDLNDFLESLGDK